MHAYDSVCGLSCFSKQNADIDWTRFTPRNHRVQVEWWNWHLWLPHWQWRSQKLKMIMSRQASGVLFTYTDTWRNISQRLSNWHWSCYRIYLQYRECIGLRRVTSEDITLDSPGENWDQCTRRNEEGAVAVAATEVLLWEDTWITATGSLTPEGIDQTAGLGCCVGGQSMTRPPGYSLSLLPSIHDVLANIDGAVWRHSQQMNDNWEWTLYIGTPQTYEANETQVHSPCKRLSSTLGELEWPAPISVSRICFEVDDNQSFTMAIYTKLCGILLYLM